MISGSLCGMFQSEEEHKRKRKLCATGSLPACVILICLFYSLCIWLCLIWRLPSRIIPAAASPSAVSESASYWGGVSRFRASLRGLTTRCRLVENSTPQVLHPPHRPLHLYSHTEAAAAAPEECKTDPPCCNFPNHKSLIPLCRHDCACACGPVRACVNTCTCARGGPKALLPPPALPASGRG